MKKIFITGGAGYVGSKMTPYFLDKGYKVTVYDIMYFTDNFLPKNNSNLNIIKGDIRDTEKLKVTNNVKADLQVGRDYRDGWKPKAII